MGSTTRLEEGRQAIADRAWREAYEALAAAHQAEALAGPDLWRLALACYLVGHEEAFLSALAEAHQSFLDAEDTLGAVRAAFWMGQHLMSRGDSAQASGWLGRATRAFEEQSLEEARGYLLLAGSHRKFAEGDYDAGVLMSQEAGELGRRHDDADLTAIAIHVQGRALIRLARVEEGLALLDEAMVAAAGGELSPFATGMLYCSVLGACREIMELSRAREWTSALWTWCEGQPDMVAYTGPCLVSRSELLRRRGEWSRAIAEARHALDRFERGSTPGRAGPAFYEQGEVHRLRGEYAEAEEAYEAATYAGRQPQPGLALLRLAQGEAAVAAAALRRALAETTMPLPRAGLLPAHVEVLLALHDLEGAARSCAELDEIAAAWGSPVLEALAAQADGALRLARGDPEGALPRLREACIAWDTLEAPYDAARVRVLLASACRALSDDEGCRMELAAARAAFERLGATPDLRALEGTGQAAPPPDHGLTPRELEVLGWLATGRTNRQIAEALSISEKTVARHVANIYMKLGLSSRAAATAFAYEHDLARRST